MCVIYLFLVWYSSQELFKTITVYLGVLEWNLCIKVYPYPEMKKGPNWTVFLLLFGPEREELKVSIIEYKGTLFSSLRTILLSFCWLCTILYQFYTIFIPILYTFKAINLYWSYIICFEFLINKDDLHATLLGIIFYDPIEI